MNKTALKPVVINILGKNYKIACAAEEEEALLLSAQALDEQMRTIRDSGTVSGSDKIAVMAALNLTHELRNAHPADHLSEDLTMDLTKLRHKIENVLENS